MMGLDSRAAMVPGGAVEGFGNLGAALLMAPRMRAQQEDEKKKQALDQAFREKQLAQALDIAQANQMNDRARIADEANWRTQQDENQKSANAMKYGNELAKALAGGVSSIFGNEKAPPEAKVDSFSPYLEVKTPDGAVHYEQKSPDQVDREREIRDRYLHGAVRGNAPPPRPMDPAEIAANKERSAGVRTQQRAQGLAQAPGDPTPAPSVAGLPPGKTLAGSGLDQAPQVADAPQQDAAPAAASGQVVRTSKLRTMVGPAPGQYPDLATAIQEASKYGHRVLRDD